MSIRGWVYVVSNPSLAGLVKVGFSTKDPKIRVADFNSSAGLPLSHELVFDLLVVDPRAVEQRAHKLLSASHHAKEWFRCTRQMAIDAVRNAAADSAILESGDRAESGQNCETASDPKETGESGPYDLLIPSKELAAIVGAEPIPKMEIVSRLWAYVKINSLQDKTNKRMVDADAALHSIFGKSKFSMFEIADCVSQHTTMMRRN